MFEGVELSLQVAKLGVEAGEFGFVVAVGDLEDPAAFCVVGETLTAPRAVIEARRQIAHLPGWRVYSADYRLLAG